MTPAATATAIAPAATHARAKRADGIHAVPERSFIACMVAVMPVTKVVMTTTMIVVMTLTSPARPNDLVALVRDQPARLEEQEDCSDADARSHSPKLRGVLERALLAFLAVEAGGERTGPEAVDGVLLVVGAVLEVPVEERELLEVFVGDRHVFFFLFP
jgi:hypothetical protein